MIELTDSDSGSSHRVGVGEELVIRLGENPTTGYQWQLRQSGTGELRPVGDGTESGGATMMPGAASHRVVRFVGERVGRLQLEAVERRDWEPASSSKQKLVFEIVVV